MDNPLYCHVRAKVENRAGQLSEGWGGWGRLSWLVSGPGRKYRLVMQQLKS